MTLLKSACVPLCESAATGDGTLALKIIAPGWSSNNIYYSDDLLKRDGPGAFAAGTHLYWNHPSASEDIDRPERSLRDLAGVTVTSARFESQGRAGPGLFAKIKTFAPFGDRIRELASHIGASIRAEGETEHGTANGRAGQLATKISRGLSIDFVTRAAAGGLVFAESSRPNQGDTIMDTATGSPAKLTSDISFLAGSIRESQRLDEVAAEWRDIGLSESQALQAARDDMSRARIPDPPATFDALLESYGYRPGELGSLSADDVAEFWRNMGLSEGGVRAAVEGRDLSPFDRQTRERIARERDRIDARPSVDFSKIYASPQQARRAEAVAHNQMGH